MVMPGAAALAGITSMVLVGSTAAVSPLLTGYPILTGQTWRYAVAAVVLLLAVRLARPPRAPLARRQWLRLATLSATGLAGFNVFLLEAARYCEPQVLGAIVGAAPLALALAGPVLERRRPAPAVLAAAVLVVLGIAVVLGGGSADPRGVALGLGALVCECLFSLLAVPLLPALGPVRLSALACLLAVPMLLGCALIVERGRVATAPTAVEAGALAFLAILVTAVAFALWYWAVGALGVDTAGLFAGLIPVAAVGVAALLGTAQPSLRAVVGCLLVGAGVSVGLVRRAASEQAEHAEQGRRLAE